MLLQTVGKVNAISDKLRKQLDERLSGFPRFVQYQFKIENPNPDPTKEQGEYVYPRQYTLTPGAFDIVDENVKDRMQNRIKIGLVKQIDEKGEKVEAYEKIKIYDNHRGILEFDLENPDDYDKVCYLELHPKNRNSLFPQKDAHKLFERIDVAGLSKQKRELKAKINKAYNDALSMSDAEVKVFADSMGWDAPDLEILRGMVEDMAENDTDFFLKKRSDKTTTYEAAVSRAMDAKEIVLDPVNNEFKWANGRTIVMVPVDTTIKPIDWLAKYIDANPQEGKKIFDKISKFVE